MQIPQRLKELFNDVQDAGAALRLARSYQGRCLETDRIFLKLSSVSGGIAFFARPRGTPLNQFMGRHTSPRELPSASRWTGSTPLRNHLRPGDVVFAIGLDPSLKFKTAAEFCDLYDLFDGVSPEEVENFTCLVLVRTLNACRQSGAPCPRSVIRATLFVVRTFLGECEAALRRQMEHWVLERYLLDLDLQAIVDYAREAGTDILANIPPDKRTQAWDVSRNVLTYALGELERGMHTIPLPEGYHQRTEYQDNPAYPINLVRGMLITNRKQLLLELPALACLCTQPIPGSTQTKAYADTLQRSFAPNILKRLSKPSFRYWPPALQMLGACGLWDATQNELFEDALIKLMAQGGFDDVPAFLSAINRSKFPHAWNGDPGSTAGGVRHLHHLAPYIATLMPRVYECAVSLGRFDVAAFLAERTRKDLLDVSVDVQIDLANTKRTAVPHKARIRYNDSAGLELLFGEAFLPAK